MPISTSLAHRASLSARSAASAKSFPAALRSYAIPPGATPSPLSSTSTIPPATAKVPLQTRVVPTVATVGVKTPVVPVVPPPSEVIVEEPVVVVEQPAGGRRGGGGSYKGKAGWILFTVLNSYIIATYVALHNDTFEDVYTQYVPGGASIYEWADDNDLDKVGVASIVDAYNRIADGTKSMYRGITGQTYDPPAISTNPNHSNERLAALQKSIAEKAAHAKEAVSKAATDAKDAASAKTNEVATKAKEAVAVPKTTPAEDARAKAFAPVDDSALVLEQKRADAAKKAQEVKDQAAKKAEEVKQQAARKAEELKTQAKQGASAVKQEVKQDAAAIKQEAQKGAAAVQKEVSRDAEIVKAKAGEAQATLAEKARDVKEAVVDKAHDLQKAAPSFSLVDLKEEALKGIENLRAAGANAAEAAADVFDDAKAREQKAAEAVKARTWVFSEGVEDLANQAETALGRVKHDTEKKVGELKQDVKEGVEQIKNPNAGEKIPWTGPLPIGFEPPPGYFVPKASGAGKTTSDLPLIAPKVESFSASEPIISQLASTIDSLASYLASRGPASAPSTSSYTAAESAKKLINNAVGDLEALGGRLHKVQDDAKKQLEAGLEQRRVEYEHELKQKETLLEGELEKREEGWKGVVEDERRRLVEVFKEKLERELEAQSEIINERLKEEVLAQGIELQRKWMREIKVQVETERGGRLGKLEGLEKGLKDLEKVTLDNSAVLDENVKLHTLWSALRAVQSALDTPREPFAHQLSALSHSISSTPATTKSSSAISAALSTIPSSVSSSGVETLPDLTYWFTTRVAPRIRSVALVPESADSGVLSHLASAVISPLLFAKTGNVEGDDVASVISRAEDRLSRKDLDGAAREVNQLKGWAGVLAGDWLREARKRLEVEQALEIVKAEATLSSLLLV